MVRRSALFSASLVQAALEKPLSAVGYAHGPPRKETHMHPDLVVGNQFPDLTLPDHRHQPVTLSELAKGFPLLVSFYRGYW